MKNRLKKLTLLITLIEALMVVFCISVSAYGNMDNFQPNQSTVNSIVEFYDSESFQNRFNCNFLTEVTVCDTTNGVYIHNFNVDYESLISKLMTDYGVEFFKTTTDVISLLELDDVYTDLGYYLNLILTSENRYSNLDCTFNNIREYCQTYRSVRCYSVVDLSLYNDIEYLTVIDVSAPYDFRVLFEFDLSLLKPKLNVEEFLNSEQTAIEFLNLVPSADAGEGSFQYFLNYHVNSGNYITNWENFVSNVNEFGNTLRSSGSISDERFQALEEENQNLKAENSNLEETNQTLTYENMVLNEAHVVAQDNINRLTAENQSLSDDVEHYKSKVEILEDKLNSPSGNGYGLATEYIRGWLSNRITEYTYTYVGDAETIFKSEFTTNVLKLKQLGYEEGATDGIESGELVENSILTILSAPFYFLANAFNFEIFGINLFSIITVLISAAVVMFFFKKIKG